MPTHILFGIVHTCTFGRVKQVLKTTFQQFIDRIKSMIKLLFVFFFSFIQLAEHEHKFSDNDIGLTKRRKFDRYNKFIICDASILNESRW